HLIRKNEVIRRWSLCDKQLERFVSDIVNSECLLRADVDPGTWRYEMNAPRDFDFPTPASNEQDRVLSVCANDRGTAGRDFGVELRLELRTPGRPDNAAIGKSVVAHELCARG